MDPNVDISVVVYRDLSLDVVGSTLKIESTVACNWKQLKVMFDAGLDTELANLLAASRPPGADTFAHFRCGKASSRGVTDRLIPPSSTMVMNMAVMFYMPKGANTGRWFEMTMPDGPSSGFNGFWTGEVDVSDVPLCVSPSYVFVPLDELYTAWTTHGPTHPITGKKTGGSAQHMPGWRAGCNGLDVRHCVAGTYGTPGPAINDSFRTVSCLVPVSHSTEPDMAAVMKLSMYVMGGTVYAEVPLTKFKTGANTYALPLKNAWMGCTADFPVWNVQNLVPGGSVSGAKDNIPGGERVGDVFVCVFVNNVLGLSVKLNGQQHFIVAPARQPYDTMAFGSSATPLSSYMEAPNVRFMPFFSKKAPAELISVQGTHELDAQVLAEDGTLQLCDFCHGAGHSSSLKNALKDFVKGNAVDAHLVYDGMTCVLIPPPCSDIRVELRAPQHSGAPAALPAPAPAPAAAGAAAAAAPAPAGARGQKRKAVAGAAAAPAAAVAPVIAVPTFAGLDALAAAALVTRDVSPMVGQAAVPGLGLFFGTADLDLDDFNMFGEAPATPVAVAQPPCAWCDNPFVGLVTAVCSSCEVDVPNVCPERWCKGKKLGHEEDHGFVDRIEVHCPECWDRVVIEHGRREVELTNEAVGKEIKINDDAATVLQGMARRALALRAAAAAAAELEAARVAVADAAAEVEAARIATAAAAAAAKALDDERIAAAEAERIAVAAVVSAAAETVCSVCGHSKPESRTTYMWCKTSGCETGWHVCCSCANAGAVRLCDPCEAAAAVAPAAAAAAAAPAAASEPEHMDEGAAAPLAGKRSLVQPSPPFEARASEPSAKKAKAAAAAVPRRSSSRLREKPARK